MAIKAHELRQSFLEYFSSQGHTPVPSASLIPQADPTLLFTNAGMNQFKRVFLGEETRPYSRAVSVQKCMRAGGKHNDLENVGYTSRHHTFFEMLGNFSFGDYFKEEAVGFGWEFLTKAVGLPADRLWVTVYQDDDEAYRLWRQAVGVPPSRIIRLGDKDNFWQMGETGPCGPCSEILIDQGLHLSCGLPTCAVGCECDRYLEIWNLVFMQYDRDASGTLHPLPKPSIDTGMGLERLAAVSQGVCSNYGSDLFQPLIRAISERIGCRYGQGQASDRSIRVMADHLRAMTFLIADGILPSNEGRGYVLRRIIRRASRHGRLVGMSAPFLCELTGAVIAQMGAVYPELPPAQSMIADIVRGEEERFIGTLDQGLPLLHSLVQSAKAEGRSFLEGGAVFKLYDTYGFPLDLVEDIAREEALGLDQEGYQRALEEQRDRARKSAAFTVSANKPYIQELINHVEPSAFIGYDVLESEAIVEAILKDEHLVKEAQKEEDIEVVLDSTPFYPEGGGQVGDQGMLVGPSCRVQIIDTTKVGKGIQLHRGKVLEGRLRSGERVKAAVNHTLRQDAARNHTATHLVHAALRDILGPHVKQHGSFVSAHRLRFDFAHFKPLSVREIRDIESLVNEQIRADTPVQTQVMEVNEAVESGALAFFGDKYGSRVRVVGIGSFSKELCGGTHCHQTGEVGLFRIVSEGGVAAGVRRIEASTGSEAIHRVQQMDADIRELADLLKTSPPEVVPRTRKLATTLKETEQELERVKRKLLERELETTRGQDRVIHGIPVQVQQVEGLTMQELRSLSDKVRGKTFHGVVALGSSKDRKVSLLVLVSPDQVSRIHAGELAKYISKEVGGSGGGRPEMAQAGGNEPEGLGKALEKVFDYVEQKSAS